MNRTWEVLERHKLLDRSPWLRVFSETVRLEDGLTVIPDFYRVDLPSYAIIFAVTVERQVALVEQYKHGVGQRILELPAGCIEAGEEPLTCAQRELLEEAGLEALDWRSLGVFTVDGNRGCGQAHAFLALDARRVSQPIPADLEQQQVRFYDLEHLRKLWKIGGCLTVSSVALIGLGLAHVGDHSPAAG